MRPQYVTLTATGTSNWLPMDTRQAPFSVGIGVKINSGTATYTVEHTFDDIFDSTVTPVAFSNSGLSAQTTNKDGNYAFPVRAIRLNVTAGSSPNVTMAVLQGVR
jgi:hypothetical protein